MPPLATNAQQIFELIAASPDGTTRAQLAERAHMSRPTVLAAVRDLLDRDRIVETMAPPGALGRTPGLLTVAPVSGHVVGIDLGHGHGHFKVLAIGSEEPIVDHPVSLGTDAFGPVTLDLVAEFLGEELRRHDVDPGTIRGIGIGMPVGVLPGGQVIEASLPLWSGVNVRHALVKALDAAMPSTDWDGDMIHVARDADMGALGEAPSVEWSDFLYVKISTGIVGSHLLGDCEPWAVDAYRSVDLGHVGVISAAEEKLRGLNVRQARPTQCAVCNQYDCLETLASVGALARRLDLGGNSADAIEEMVKRLADDVADEREIREALNAAGWRIGYGIAAAMRICGVPRVLIGGLIVRAEKYVREPIQQAINQALASWTDVEVRFVDRDRIYHSEVDGAVALALRRSALSFDDDDAADEAPASAGTQAVPA